MPDWLGSPLEPSVKMRNLTPLMTVLAGCLSWTAASADVMGCLVEPDRVADVGSQSIGVLERVYVERGDEVTAGQLVARLSASVEKASVSVAEARSQTDAELRQAVAANELAQRKLARAKDLLKREFVSDQAVDQADAEARVAEQRVAQARDSLKVSQKEFQLSSVQLGQRDVRSPFSGIVVERFRTEGERIEREPLVRVAKIDPLRVEAIVPASQFGSITAGQMALIKTDLPSFNAMSAKVVLVDRVIDPASNSFRVRLTLPNPDHKIPSGLRCKVDFAGVTEAPARAAPVAPGRAPVNVPLNAPAGTAPAVSTTTLPKAVASASVLTPMPAAAAAAAPTAAAATPLPSTRLVTAHKAPERMLVKQYMASREPRLTPSQSMVSPKLSSSLDSERPWLSLR